MRDVQFGNLGKHETFTFNGTEFVTTEQPNTDGRTAAMSTMGRMVTFHGQDMVQVKS